MTTTTRAKKVTAAEVQDNVIGVDLVTVSKGVYKAFRGFFYTNGGSWQALASRVRAAYPSAVILDGGEVWKPFKGGAPVNKQSHWWVTFRLGE